jgi:pantetheine-phosphate adenylyltransferase
MFDRVIILVARNSNKKPLFEEGERLAMITEATAYMPTVEVDTFSGLVVDYGKSVGATAIIRGLRAVTDFEYEFQIALMNRKLAPDIATVFLMPHERYTYLSSSIIRELARHHSSFAEFVPDVVHRKLREKFGVEVS